MCAKIPIEDSKTLGLIVNARIWAWDRSTSYYELCLFSEYTKLANVLCNLEKNILDFICFIQFLWDGFLSVADVHYMSEGWRLLANTFP